MDPFSILTQAGLNKVASVLANQQPFDAMTIAIGDGRRIPGGLETELEHEVARFPVRDLGTVPGQTGLAFFKTFFSEADGPFLISEAGIFDGDGTLLALAHYPDPIPKPLNIASLEFEIVTAISQLENIVLTTNASTAFVPADRRITVGVGLTDNSGGDLTEDRTFDVDISTVPDALAGLRNDVVMTPFTTEAVIEDALGLYAQVSALANFVTQADIDAAITGLINGAPAALDTLRELADKLGDNGDAIAALTAQIAQKLNTSDLTFADLDAARAATATDEVMSPVTTLQSVRSHTGLGGVANAPPGNNYNTIRKGGVYAGTTTTTGNPVAGEPAFVLHQEGTSTATQKAITSSGRMLWRFRANTSSLSWSAWRRAISDQGGEIDGDLRIQGNCWITGTTEFDGDVTFKTENHAFRFLSVDQDGNTNRSLMEMLYNGVPDWRMVHRSGGNLDISQPPNPANPGARLLINGQRAWADSDNDKNFGTNGYQIYPSGLIHQWRQVNLTTSNQTVTFPITFPNACRGVIGGDDNANNNNASFHAITTRSVGRSSFQAVSRRESDLSFTSTVATFWAWGY